MKLNLVKILNNSENNYCACCGENIGKDIEVIIFCFEDGTIRISKEHLINWLCDETSKPIITRHLRKPYNVNPVNPILR